MANPKFFLPPLKHHVKVLSGPNDLKIYHTGTDLTNKPLPAFFYFALAGDESLSLDPFNQPVVFLASSQVHIFSFTLPFHGPEIQNKNVMALWRDALLQGDDFIQNFVDKAKENIDYLIQVGMIDPRALAVGGLSRGGFMAAHLAAQDPRINIILGFAPLLGLDVLQEVENVKDRLCIIKHHIRYSIEKLCHCHLHFYIGNHDTRVGTRDCFEVVEALSWHAHKQGVRSPPIEMTIKPSIGHKGHGTAPNTFFEGINWLKQKLSIVN